MKHWHSNVRRTPEGEETTRLILETLRLSNALMTAGDDLAREFGLTSARWQVLGAVRDEPRTISGIARFLGLTRQSVQRTVHRLEQDGFVELVENPDHRRAHLVSPADLGRTTLEALSEKQTAWVNEIARDMASANIRIATGILRGLGNRLREGTGTD